jgi:hypothetical protein
MFAIFLIGGIGAVLGMLAADALPPDGATQGVVQSPPGVTAPATPDLPTDDTGPVAAPPSFPPPDAWVPHQYAGITFRAPAPLAGIYEEGTPHEPESYSEFVLWESADASRSIYFHVTWSDLSYPQMLEAIEADDFSVTEHGIVDLQGVPFHAIEVRDRGADIPYLDHGYFAVEPDADGLRLEIYAGASLESPDDYEPVLRALLESVTLPTAGAAGTGPTPPENAASPLGTAAPDDAGSPAERASEARDRAQTLQADGDYLGALLAYRESMAADPNDDIAARIQSLERYLSVKGIEVPPAD